jgi:serine/threonine protein phosphatase PrpC
LASLFEVQSQEEAGTALLARLLEGKEAGRYFDVGAINIPVAGEEECGDAWSAHHGPGRSLFMLADGLGHGPAAAEAAQEAVRVFQETVHLSLHEMLSRMHDALKKTRGAAVSIAEIHTDTRTVKYAGVGNISASVISGGKTRSMVSHNGTLGHTEVRVQEFQYPWPKDALLVMHSDGLSARWNLDRYPGLQGKHSQLIAGVLYRDFRRERDDATVLVAREVSHA